MSKYYKKRYMKLDEMNKLIVNKLNKIEKNHRTKNEERKNDFLLYHIKTPIRFLLSLITRFLLGIKFLK